VKITCIETQDGVALLAYAGIGRVNDTRVSWWVYRTLRGLNIPLERSLERVYAAAQRRLAPYIRHAGAHFFIASAIREGKHYLYVIDLRRRQPPQVIRHEPRTRTQVRIGISGSGALYAQRYEQSRMTSIARLVRQYERGNVSAEFIASQLASLNVAISARARMDGDNTVSPQSIVIHRHPKSKKSGGQEWSFDAEGKPANDQDASVPIVANGFPAAELLGGLRRHMTQRMRAMPPDASLEQRLNVLPDDATLRALAASIPDTPDERLP
jgi:hypothetical protein